MSKQTPTQPMTKPVLQPEFLPQSAVRARYGNPSPTTFWRWTRGEKIGFPKPISIGSRNFWRIADLEAFEQRQQAEG